MEAEQVVEKILSDAQAEAEKIKKEADEKEAAEQAELTKQLEEYEKQTEVFAQKAGEERKMRLLAAARMEIAKDFLGEKRKILDEVFEQAAIAAKSLPQRPDDTTMLSLYALYKQGSSGDVQGDKPGFFDFVGSAKYEAWEKLKGTSQEEARSQYVELIRKLGGTF